MVCIYCGQPTHVTNSRLQKKQNHVWRRRHCLSCGSIFTTLEQADLLTAVTVTAQGQYKPFSRDTLLVSIYDSLKHRKTALSDATALTDTVISKLLPAIDEARLERDQIVQITHQILHRFDKAAATSYAAYHPL